MSVDLISKRPRRAEVPWRRSLAAVGRGPLGTFDGALGALIVFVVIFVAIFGSDIAPYSPSAINFTAQLSAPSGAHLFGTDELGRDILSRVLAGAGQTIPASLAVVGIAMTAGGSIGLIAGYVGGKVDNVLMRITDMFLGYPAFLLAIAVVSSLGPGLSQAVISLSILWWAGYARLVRTQVRLVRNLEYVEAARAVGASDTRIVFRHIAPNIVGPMLVKATVDVSLVVESIAALGFIGLGAQPPSPEWGTMIATSRQYALDAWWYPVFPGIALLVTVVGFNLLGDALSRRSRKR
jgi:peptide/nickel transport system permease protein